MSYWLESLLDSLNSTPPDDQEGKALSILAHLSMDVPRLWWTRSLNQGNPQEDHVGLLKGLFSELENYPPLSGDCVAIHSRFEKWDKGIKFTL